MRNILYLCVIALFVSCTYSKTKKGEYVLYPKKNLQCLLDSFTRLNCDKKFNEYELYINKEDPHNYTLLLYAGDKSLTMDENQYYGQTSLVYVVSNGLKVKVFSGIEHYLDNGKNDIEKHKLSGGDEHVLWCVKDSFNVISVREVYGAYPFMPLPKQINVDLLPSPEPYIRP